MYAVFISLIDFSTKVLTSTWVSRLATVEVAVVVAGREVTRVSVLVVADSINAGSVVVAKIPLAVIASNKIPSAFLFNMWALARFSTAF